MRLWSVHPVYLDAKGLTACWREGLLARKVLLGETRGYRNHPQLSRFKTASDPLAAIDRFLAAVLAEAQSRGYHYDASKINLNADPVTVQVTRGQIEYEVEHLKKKLAGRDRSAYERLLTVEDIALNPLFTLAEGEIESWETSFNSTRHNSSRSEDTFPLVIS